mmetsp:Transcript_42749/g.79156  ORF Transcript_42749/g.79156 Transcript_42749/m.79156 type:complete len:292 (-) Transcript_42749:294-1169(-)
MKKQRHRRRSLASNRARRSASNSAGATTCRSPSSRRRRSSPLPISTRSVPSGRGECPTGTSCASRSARSHRWRASRRRGTKPCRRTIGPRTPKARPPHRYLPTKRTKRPSRRRASPGRHSWPEPPGVCSPYNAAPVRSSSSLPRAARTTVRTSSTTPSPRWRSSTTVPPATRSCCPPSPTPPCSTKRRPPIPPPTRRSSPTVPTATDRPTCCSNTSSCCRRASPRIPPRIVRTLRTPVSSPIRPAFRRSARTRANGRWNRVASSLGRPPGSSSVRRRTRSIWERPRRRTTE